MTSASTITLQVAEKVENTKQIEVKTNGNAEFEFDMKLRDPNSKIYLYKVRSTDSIDSEKIPNIFLTYKKHQ